MEEDTHKYISMYCPKCGFNKDVRLYCGLRLCPDCKKNNYYRLLRIYTPLVKNISGRRFSQITLTMRNFSFLNSSKVQEIKKNFYKLRKTFLFKSQVRGGIGVIECKHEDEATGWNLHLHILVDSSYLPQRNLKTEWFRITGDSYIVDIRKEENSPRAIKHLLKYFIKTPIIKSSQGKEEELKSDYESAFFGSRNIISFGSLYSAVAEREHYKYECPICGCRDTFINSFELYQLSERSIKVKAGVG